MPQSPPPSNADTPSWLRVGWSLLLCVLVPVYWRHYGPANFLWFSDVALFQSTAALWLADRSVGRDRPGPLLASMAAVGVLIPEAAWNLDLLTHLLSGHELFGLARYMFDPKYPLYLRLLSLFHLPLPVLLLWLVRRLGYDRRALIAQTALAWVIYLLIYAVKPSENIDWAFGLRESPQSAHPRFHLAGIMLGYPLVVHLPTHLLLRKLFPPPPPT